MKRACCGAILSLMLFGCGPAASVHMKSGTTFTPQSTITIVGGNDHLGVQGKLEHLFLSRGFNVVSEAVARSKTQYEDKIQNIGDGSAMKAEVGRVTEVKSAYIMRYSYTRAWDTAYDSFKSFSATIIDLRTGEVVSSTNYAPGYWSIRRGVDSVLEEVVDKLVGTK